MIMGLRLHDEYTFKAVNTHTRQYLSICHSDRKSSCHVPR